MLIVIGYRREDLRLVNLGMAGLAWLVLARYFDFFWDLLPRSGFFMGGGCLLVLGGLALERKRRELKLQFANHRIILFKRDGRSLDDVRPYAASVIEATRQRCRRQIRRS